MTAPRHTLVAVLASWAAVASVGAAEWVVDPAVSRVGFTATWDGSAFDGVFRRFQAVIDFDPSAPSDGRFDVVVDVTSVDTQSADRDEGMGAPEWFHFGRFPSATFVADAVRGVGGDNYEAQGTLTIKGISRALTLPFTWTGDADAARMTSEVTLRRTDFNVGEGDWASDDPIGVDVRVTVDLTLLAP